MLARQVLVSPAPGSRVSFIKHFSYVLLQRSSSMSVTLCVVGRTFGVSRTAPRAV